MKYILVIGDGMADNPVEGAGREDAAGGGGDSYHRPSGGGGAFGLHRQLPEGSRPEAIRRFYLFSDRTPECATRAALRWRRRLRAFRSARET